MEHIRLSTTLLATPAEIYDAWVSSEGHSAMTGSAASSEPGVGGTHTAWDGYISGKHLELEPPRRIVQTWRTTEFVADDPDSVVEVLLVAVPEGTRMTITQSGIPDGQGEMVSEGWQDRYFAPMSRHFVTAPPKAETPPPPETAPAAVRPPPKKTAKKPARKAPAKKAARKSAAKAPKKAARKSAAKAPKKAARKSAAKAPKKVAKKTATRAPAKATPKAKKSSPKKVRADATPRKAKK